MDFSGPPPFPPSPDSGANPVNTKGQINPWWGSIDWLGIILHQKVNWLSVFRYATYQLWLHRQFPLRFLFKHQLLLILCWVKYFSFSLESSQEGFGLNERGLTAQRCPRWSHYLQKQQIKSTGFESQGSICKFLASLLKVSFFFFFNVLKKLMLLVSDAVLYQSAVPGKPSTCVLQKKGDRYVAFLISPFILRLQCAVLRNV